jgi:hypothetical protein
MATFGYFPERYFSAGYFPDAWWMEAASIAALGLEYNATARRREYNATARRREYNATARRREYNEE